jgi:drug/metabolite transporter (DMT)-like permease
VPHAHRHRRLAALALVTAGALWGVSLPLGKYALQDLPPAHLVLYRFALGTALLLPLGRWRGLRLPRRDALLLVGASVLLVPATFLLTFEGLARTTATSAALLVGTAPPMLALMAWTIGGERPGRRTVFAAAASTVGVALLVGARTAGRTLEGDLLVAASVVSASGAAILTKGLVRRHDTLTVTAAMFAIGTVLLVPAAVYSGPSGPLGLETWRAVIVLGAGCTALTYGLWNWALRHLDAAEAGVFVNLEPVVGAFLGVYWLGESVGPRSIAGGALILLAALTVTVAVGRRRRVAAPPEAVPLPGTVPVPRLPVPAEEPAAAPEAEDAAAREAAALVHPL